MGRPKKNNANYFSHDAGMRNHRKIKAIRNHFKNGYAIWCMLLEYLTESENNVFVFNEIEVELLAGDFGVSGAEITEMVHFCIRLELLFLKDNFVWSETLNNRLNPVFEKRGRQREFPGQKLDKNDSNGTKVYQKVQSEVVSAPVSTQTKLNYINTTNTNTENEEKIDVGDDGGIQSKIILDNAKKQIGYELLSEEKKQLIRDLIKRTKTFSKVDDEILQSKIIKFNNEENYLTRRSKVKKVKDVFYYSPNDGKIYSLLDIILFLSEDKEFIDQVKTQTKLPTDEQVFEWLAFYADHFYVENSNDNISGIRKHITNCWRTIPGERFREKIKLRKHQ